MFVCPLHPSNDGKFRRIGICAHVCGPRRRRLGEAGIWLSTSCEPWWRADLPIRQSRQRGELVRGISLRSCSASWTVLNPRRSNALRHSASVAGHLSVICQITRINSSLSTITPPQLWSLGISGLPRGPTGWERTPLAPSCWQARSNKEYAPRGRGRVRWPTGRALNDFADGSSNGAPRADAPAGRRDDCGRRLPRAADGHVGGRRPPPHLAARTKRWRWSAEQVR